jgi:hypothetical protein
MVVQLELEVVVKDLCLINILLKENKSDNLLIVFTRNPELGKVKTRLAKTVGAESALRIYKFLLNHTEQTIRQLDEDKAVFFSAQVRSDDIWANNVYQKYLQIGDNLGEKMFNAFKNSFSLGYKKVIIIGSDLYDLKEKHIKESFQKLESNKYVVGPAKDGGYYLIGLTHLNNRIFKNKAWGTETVFKDTMNDLVNESVFLLEELNDIDTYEDMQHNAELKALIQ